MSSRMAEATDARVESRNAEREEKKGAVPMGGAAAKSGEDDEKEKADSGVRPGSWGNGDVGSRTPEGAVEARGEGDDEAGEEREGEEERGGIGQESGMRRRQRATPKLKKSRAPGESKRRGTGESASRATASNDRALVPLAWISKRWTCSRQSARRILVRHGVRPVYLSDARNGLLRFDAADVLNVERKSQQADES